jgi:outer membrane protein assembly factor BamA
VAEGKHRKVTFGVGYGTEEQARARVRWDHVNFFGGARHAGFEGKWSSLDRGIRADYREPYFFHPHFSLGFEGQAWQAAERAYSANTFGGRATMRHQANSRDKWSVSLINEYSRHVEQAGRWMLGSFNYLGVLGEGRHYLTLGRRLVVANRLRIGTLDPVDDIDENVPFHKRYFLGGSTSMRGWGRFELSPLSGAGLPIGGLSMLDASAEIRTPLWGKLGAVAFLDYGNVWNEGWKFELNDLRYAVGPGLRYLTPIGPARFDLGYQLKPIEGLLVNGEPQKRRWRMHFSIGQAF